MTPERPGTAAEQEARRLWWCPAWGTLNATRYHGDEAAPDDPNCGKVSYARWEDYAALRADNELLAFGARKLQEERDRLTAALEQASEISAWIATDIEAYQHHTRPKGQRPDLAGWRRAANELYLAVAAALTPASGSEGGEAG